MDLDLPLCLYLQPGPCLDIWQPWNQPEVFDFHSSSVFYLMSLNLLDNQLNVTFSPGF